MSLYSAPHLTGYLFTLDPTVQGRRDFMRSENLSEPQEDVHGWITYTYRTLRPIPGVDGQTGGAPFHYHLVFRWGRGRVLLLSTNHKIVKFYVEHDIQIANQANVRRSEIFIHELVSRILDNRTPIIESEPSLKNVVLADETIAMMNSIVGGAPSSGVADDLFTVIRDEQAIRQHLEAFIASGRTFENSRTGERELLEEIKALEVTRLLRLLIDMNPPISFEQDLARSVMNQDKLIWHLTALVREDRRLGVSFETLAELRQWIVRQETLRLLANLIGTDSAPTALQRLEPLQESPELIGFLTRLTFERTRLGEALLDLDQLVAAIRLEEKVEQFRRLYDLGYVIARTDAFGDHLHSIAFYGNSVQDASILDENKKILRFSGCRLRRQGADIVRLGKDGFVSFFLPTHEPDRKQRLSEIDSVIKRLVEVNLVY